MMRTAPSVATGQLLKPMWWLPWSGLRILISSKANSLSQNWGYVSVVASTIIGKIDYKNKDLAGFYFRACAETLGAETSIDILRDSFGPAILKQALAKKEAVPLLSGTRKIVEFTHISAP
jgi:hypothetical protein